MDFEKVLSLRQAVRAYTDEPVSEEQLKAILNAPIVRWWGCTILRDII